MQLSSTVCTSGFSVISRVTSSQLSIVCRPTQCFCGKGGDCRQAAFERLCPIMSVSDSCSRNNAPEKQRFGTMQTARSCATRGRLRESAKSNDEAMAARCKRTVKSNVELPCDRQRLLLADVEISTGGRDRLLA